VGDPKAVLKKGQRAPDFLLSDAAGEKRSLSEFLLKGWVVLFFYPRDDTLICTREACQFRDHYEVFKEHGAEVVGISSDSTASHMGFALRHQLPFPLLSDEGGKVRRKYGVTDTLGLLPGRVTFVIDPAGTVRHVFSSQLRAGRHVAEAIRTLEEGRTEA
jgi:peroxiredoxin Q/BCP